VFIPTTTLTTGGGGDFELFFDSTLGADAASFDVTGIPGTYKHLQINAQLRGAGSGGTANIRFNNDSSAIYDYSYMQSQGNGGAASQNAAVAQTSAFISALAGSAASAGIATAVLADIPNYAATVFHKTYSSRDFTASDDLVATQFVHLLGGRWRSTAAITRITIFPGTGDFLAGSRLSVYGLS
jgi:hypothetical protein